MARPKYLTVGIMDRGTIARLFSTVETDSSSGCWNWTGVTANGYGYTYFSGKKESIHRLMFAWLRHPLPRGLGGGIPVVDHLCNNRLCCNPAHMRMTDNRTNSLRAVGSQAWINSNKTHCKRGHEFPTTPKQRNGRVFRECPICQRITRAALRQNPKKLAQHRAYHRAYYHKMMARDDAQSVERKAKKRAYALRKYYERKAIRTHGAIPSLP